MDGPGRSGNAEADSAVGRTQRNFGGDPQDAFDVVVPCLAGLRLFRQVHVARDEYVSDGRDVRAVDARTWLSEVRGAGW